MNVQFGDYRLKRTERLLLGPRGPVDLSARSFDILATLLAKPDTVVGKAELFDAVWPGLVVEENTLQVHISALRKALDDGMIMTVHGRGYKYAGPMPVAALPGPSPAAGGTPTAARPSIAVLPFANMSDDPEQRYFSDGITEDIITAVSRFPSLFVVAQASSFAFREQELPVSELARQLGVAYILEGSVRKAGNRVRITAQLIEAASGKHIWSEHYDRSLEDVFAVQDEVARVIAWRLTAQVEGDIVAHPSRQRPENFAAYDFMLRGMQLQQRDTHDDTAAAIPLFERSIELDPTFGEAHSWLAMCHIFYRTYDLDTAALARASELARSGVRLDERNARCQIAAGYCAMYSGQFDEAEFLHNRAALLNPNEAHVAMHVGAFHAYAGQPERSESWFAIGRMLNPFPPVWYRPFERIAHYGMGHYTDAAPASHGTWDNVLDLAYITASLGQMGRAEEAKASLTRCRELVPAGLSVRAYVEAEPYRLPASNAHLLDGLRKAGLTE